MPTKRKDAHSVLMRIQSGVQAALESRKNFNPLISTYLRSIQKSSDEFARFTAGLNKNFEFSLLSELRGQRVTVPKVTHRVWVTSLTEPQFPPAAYLQRVEECISDATFDCINYIWSNSPEVRSFLKDRFRAVGATVVIQDTRDLSNDYLYEFVERLIEQKKYVFSTDLLRIMFLRRYGGVYSDFGIWYSREYIELVFLSECALLLGGDNFFQTSLLGFPANSDVLAILYGVLGNSHVLPKAWLGDGELTATNEVNALAGPGFTALLHLFSSGKERILVAISDEIHVSWTSRASWYGAKPQFGNALISEAQPSIVNPSAIDQYESNIENLLITVNCPRKYYWKLYILLGLTGYFARFPTRLCEIMYFNQSDKALAWHNYSYVYNYILPEFVPEGGEGALLEVGIGTNYLDVPSSMGATGVPGASLRGWKEFLRIPIYGADVDSRILFKDEGIDTSFVDQLDPATIRKLWETVPTETTIVIDDGLHTFEANVNFWVGTQESNRATRIFIIEDVFGYLLNDWKDYLTSASIQSAILRIPNATNDSDNNLVMIFPA